MAKNEWFTIRKTPTLKRQIADLMRWGGYVTYAELFRSLIRIAWEAHDR